MINSPTTIAQPRSDRLKQAIASPLLLGVVVFFLALGPRILDLQVFVGPDEFSWVVRSANFAQALRQGHLIETYQTGHPGVTLMWLETIGAALRDVVGGPDLNVMTGSEKTMAVLAARREIIGAANALLLMAAVLLVQQIFGSEVAWVAGILLAFDPFALTEFRALRTEGVVTSFSMLAILTLVWYLKRPRLNIIVGAGMMIGLALLSKASAVALLPIGVVLIAAPHLFDQAQPLAARLHSFWPALIIWVAVISLTILLCWPALWVDPAYVIHQMVDYVAVRAVEGVSGGQTFFLGEELQTEALDARFYPLVMLYRTNPLVWLGLLLVLILLWPLRRFSRQDQWKLSALSLYVLIYYLVISNASLKFDRYIIPLLPILSIIAAVGLVKSWAWLSERRPLVFQSFGWAAAALLLIGQLGLTIPYHPYYYTYWNPAFGGIKAAMQVLPIGVGGEGIDRAAAYLNSLPDPASIRLATANSQKIAPLFRGETIAMTNLDGYWYTADKTFIFVSQAHQGKHNAEILDYLAGHKPLLYKYQLGGIDYGWIYEGPGAQHYGGDTKLEGRARLHAFSLSTAELHPGDTLDLTLFFRNEGQTPPDRFFVHLTDADGYIWAQDAVRPKAGFETAFDTRKSVVEGEASLILPVGMLPGQYVLQMGYDNAETGEVIGRFELPADHDTIAVLPPDSFPALKSFSAPNPLDLTIGRELWLAGYDLIPAAGPGQTIWATLYWQALTEVQHDYVIALQLLTDDDTEAAYWLGRPARSSLPTNDWRAGQVMQDPWRLDLPSDLAAGTYQLRLVLYDAETSGEVARTVLQTVTIVP